MPEKVLLMYWKIEDASLGGENELLTAENNRRD
jgi:hypothetical protein